MNIKRAGINERQEEFRLVVLVNHCHGIEDDVDALALHELKDQTGPEEELDFGDAPDTPYPTLLTNNGARHAITGLTLGTSIDPEGDGQPNATATGDDIANLADEDGVTFTTPLVAGAIASASVVVSGQAS